jgi:hypothetical protein
MYVDLIADLRSRINPTYATHIGTESYERRICVEALEAQQAEIAELRAEIAKREWQPIETAPNDGTVIDLFAGGKRVENCEYNVFQYKDWCRNLFSDDGDELLGVVPYPITHWMPLPDAPKEK